MHQIDNFLRLNVTQRYVKLAVVTRKTPTFSTAWAAVGYNIVFKTGVLTKCYLVKGRYIDSDIGCRLDG